MVRNRRTGIMEAAASVHGYVSNATRSGRGVDWYDIRVNDDDDHGSARHGWSDGDDYRWGRYGWHGDQQWEQCQWWDRHAWWQDGEVEQLDRSDDMDLRDVQVPRWMRNDAAAAWGGRAGKRGRAGADEWGTQGRHADAGEVPTDHEAAARLQAQQSDAIAAAQAAAAAAHAAGEAAAAAATPPTPSAESLKLEQRRQQVWDQAQAENVAVACSEIAAMSAEELEKWASENLV